ncbi:HAD family hydrolase [soil metagenome]
MEPSLKSPEKNDDRSFAFFDLDHTLLPFDTQAMFCNYVLQQERSRSFFLLGFLPIAILRACKLVPTVTAKRAFMGYLTGMDRETLRSRARNFAEKVVKPQIYPELLAIIEAHRSAGRILVLNTASPDFYPHEIARILGFDHCIATKVEPHDPMPFMPVVIGSNNKREAKIAAMRRELPEVAAATEQQLRDSWSYSDSAADLPLLEFAGNAMLIHPNTALAAIGVDRGWKILKPERPYQTKLGDILCSLQQALGIYHYRKN